MCRHYISLSSIIDDAPFILRDWKAPVERRRHSDLLMGGPHTAHAVRYLENATDARPTSVYFAQSILGEMPMAPSVGNPSSTHRGGDLLHDRTFYPQT
jgi:hypothetical protein